MATHQGIIEAISHRYDKFAILYNEKWYNTKKEYAEEWPVMPTVGDEISWDDGGKKYLGKMKIIKKNTSAPAPQSLPSTGGGYSNIGVEMGHASKLAMDMALASAASGYYEVASAEFYKFWAKETLKVHSYMTKLKAKASSSMAPVTEEETPADDEEEEVQVISQKEAPKPDYVDDDDLF